MTTHTTAAANAAGPIVALDLGKDKSVACVYRTADDPHFTTLPTTRAELTRLFARQQPAGGTPFQAVAGASPGLLPSLHRGNATPLAGPVLAPMVAPRAIRTERNRRWRTRQRPGLVAPHALAGRATLPGATKLEKV